MDGGRPEKNPSVLVWLKYFDKELYEAIDDQGISGILKPRFGSTLTFLYPAEESYRKDIIAKLNGADATIGVNMIQAHVIKDMLADPAEWLEKKDNIPNALGQKVELSGESSNKSVVLANGANLTLNKDFKSRDDNIAVWDYKGKSPMPLDGKPAEFVKRVPKPPGAGKKRKTAMGGSGRPVFPRKCVLAKRLQDQAVCLLREGSWQGLQESNPFTAAVVSLHDYVKRKHSEKLDEFNLLCEPNSVAAFYAIVMPYSKTSYFDNAIIESWLQETRGVCMIPSANQVWASHVQGLGDAGSRIHARVMENKDQEIKPKALGAFGKSIYQTEFKSNPDARLNGDELRFVINVVMSKHEGLTAKDLSDLFLDLEIIYGKDDRSFFLVSDSNNDPVFLDTVVVFMSSRCFASVPNPTGGSHHIGFKEVMNDTSQVDPYDDFVTDDEIYLKAPDTNKESEFIEGFRKVLQGMPQEYRDEFINSLSA